MRRSWLQRIALFAGLPLLLAVSFATWRLWLHVQSLDRSLTESRRAGITLLTQVRDAVGREELAGKALQQALLERDAALREAGNVREAERLARQEALRQQGIADRLRLQRERELDRMGEALGMIAHADRTPTGVVVRLGEDSFLFDFDSSDLKPANREILSRIAGVLLASYGYKVYVYGHTDDQGDAAYNQALSERRAQAVRAYLAAAGISGDIIEAEGFGMSNPRAEGRSKEARQRNRRVEIGIVDTVVTYTGEQGLAGDAEVAQ